MASKRVLILSSMGAAGLVAGAAVLAFIFLPPPNAKKQAKRNDPPAIEQEKPDETEPKRPRQELELTLEPDTKVIYPFEPLYLTIGVKNLSGRAVRLIGSAWGNLSIFVSFAGEEFVERWHGRGSEFDFDLKPGHETLLDGILFRSKVAANEQDGRFAFAKPGKYVVRASLKRNEKIFESAAVEIRVEEPDEINEKAGRRVSQPDLADFLDEAIHTSPAGAAESAAVAAESTAEKFPTAAHADYLHFALMGYYDGHPSNRGEPDHEAKKAADHAKQVSNRIPRMRMRANLDRMAMTINGHDARGSWQDAQRAELLDELEPNIGAVTRMADGWQARLAHCLPHLRNLVAIRRGDTLALIRLSIENPGKTNTFFEAFATGLVSVGENGKRSIPQLRQAMKDADPRARLLAAYAIAILDPDDQGSMDYLVSVIKSPQAPLRMEAIRSARRRPDHPGLAAALLPILRQEKDPDMRIRALRILLTGKTGQTPDVKASLDELLRDPSPDFRLRVVGEAIDGGQDHATAVLPVLLESLKDPEIQRRITAAMYLRSLDLKSMETEAKPAIKLLIEALKDQTKNEYHELRYHAAHALAAFGPAAREAVPALTLALSDPHENVRDAVSKALRAIQGSK